MGIDIDFSSTGVMGNNTWKKARLLKPLPSQTIFVHSFHHALGFHDKKAYEVNKYLSQNIYLFCFHF